MKHFSSSPLFSEINFRHPWQKKGAGPRKCVRCIAAGIVFTLFSLPAFCATASLSGETSVYQVRWSFIPAGEVTLEVLADEMIGGTQLAHYRLRARTLPHLDVFYRVRDLIDSYSDGQRSYRYEKKQREGHTRRRITLQFDWENMLVSYRNFDETRPPATILEGTVDPLAAYYYLRSLPLAPGMVIERPVTDGKKTVLGRARVTGTEEVVTPAGRFRTLVIEPDMQDVRGVFEKTRDATMYLWLTDDDSHLLVRARSRVAVGSFVAELVRYVPPAADGTTVASGP